MTFLGNKVRAAIAAKATKAVALPRFWDQLTLSQPGEADYGHHSSMGLVWLKFAMAALKVEWCNPNVKIKL